MFFRKWGYLVGPENSIFQKLKSVDLKKMPLSTEIILHFYFPFKVFPENFTERERARARESLHSPTIAISSTNIPVAVDRDLAITRSRRWSRSRLREIAPDRDRNRRRDLTKRRSRDRERGRSRQRRERKIAISRRRRDRDRAVELDLSPDWIWVVACVFLDLCFPSSFPNTRKYFLKFFLKCNQTHGIIFLFQKLAFPENIYFPKNVLDYKWEACHMKLKHFTVKSKNMHNCVSSTLLLSPPLWHGLTCVLNMTGQFVIVLG